MKLLLALLLGLLTSSVWCQRIGGEFTLLQGTVLSHDGKHVYGAFIYLDPPEGDLPQHTGDWRTDRPEGYSRENGLFTVLKPQGKYRLTVWIGNQRIFVLPIELKGEEQKVEIRLPPLPTLRGKLIDQEGKPVPKMMVVLTNPKEVGPPRLTISDSNGEFLFLLPPLGEATVSVMSPASPMGEEKLAEQKVVVTGDENEEVILKLPALPHLTLRVIKRDGKPLVNATVIVTVGFESSELETDKEGLVALPFMSRTGAQKILLRARNEGWAILAVNPKQLPSQPISVRLQPFASVSGKVVTPDNKPIANVEVAVAPVTPNPFPLGNLEQSVKTDGKGQFKVDELWAGNYLFRIQDDRFRMPGFGASLWLASGQSKTLTLLAVPAKKSLEHGAIIVGQVLDADGKPVPEVTVQLNKQLPSPWGFMEVKPSKPVKTDEQGRFELTDISSGWHVLSAQTKDGKDVVRWVYVPPTREGKAQQISVTLQIPKEFGSIKGRVFKDGGKTPAEGVGVMAIESHYYLVNMWGTQEAALNLQIDENQTICVGGG